jgi:hypothetical protein
MLVEPFFFYLQNYSSAARLLIILFEGKKYINSFEQLMAFR